METEPYQPYKKKGGPSGGMRLDALGGYLRLERFKPSVREETCRPGAKFPRTRDQTQRFVSQ